MRRFQALLIAGLAAAPLSAVAGPSHEHSWSDTKTFEWSSSKGRLGVLITSMTPELRKHLGAAADRGVLVERVESGTPAATAGIMVGDVIVQVHGQNIDEATDVIGAIRKLGKGADVAVEVVRDGKPLALHAKLMDDASTAQSMMFDEPNWFDWAKPAEPIGPKAKRDEPSWMQRWREWLGQMPNQSSS